jgi:hypothetical protein
MRVGRIPCNGDTFRNSVIGRWKAFTIRGTSRFIRTDNPGLSIRLRTRLEIFFENYGSTSLEGYETRGVPEQLRKALPTLSSRKLLHCSDAKRYQSCPQTFVIDIAYT